MHNHDTPKSGIHPYGAFQSLKTAGQQICLQFNLALLL